MEFNRLKKWENELNICIRCGYCYEHCHLFKLFNWESDTPRGKLLLLYGLLTGEIKPSQYIAEKIFQCFYCKKCSDSCSAQVPVTDIFTDARADLIDAGFDAEGTIVRVDENLCSVCGICVPVCKSEALSITKENNGNRKIIVDKAKCKGCGLCVAACPSGAISQKEGFEVSLPELHEKVKSLLKTDEDKKLIVFCCNWSIFPGLQLSELPAVIKTPFGIIVSMCSGRVTPELILDAFKEGAWGVMVSGCPTEECEHNGNYKTKRRFLLFKNLLKQLNIEPERVRLEWFSTGESMKLNQTAINFADELARLGPIKKN